MLTYALGPLLLHAAVFCLGGLVTAYLTHALVASAKTQGGSMARNRSVVFMVYTLSAAAGSLLTDGAVDDGLCCLRRLGQAARVAAMLSYRGSTCLREAGGDAYSTHLFYA